MFAIITSKPKYPHDPSATAGARLAVIYRGVGNTALKEGTPELPQPWVVATITDESLRVDEWFWGHYFDTLTQAVAFYDAQE